MENGYFDLVVSSPDSCEFHIYKLSHTSHSVLIFSIFPLISSEKQELILQTQHKILKQLHCFNFIINHNNHIYITER